MITLLAAVLSGIMFYLSQGYDHVWALIWLAPVPLLWLAYGKARTWQVIGASAIALLGGAGYMLQSPYLHLIPPLVLTSVLAVDIGLFCVAVWFARFVHHRASPLLTLLAFPACWTAFEFLIELQSPNGTYGSLAYSTMSAPVLIQSASLVGMYAVTFLICLFANTLAMALRPKRDTAAVCLGLTICAANLVFGIVRLAHPQPDVLRVAGIVDETAVADSWRAKTVSAGLAVTETYAREIRAAAREGARFVATSEGGMASIPAGQSTIVAPLVAAAKDTGVQIIAGFHSETPAADFALAITPDGRIQRYDKRHPVPGLEDDFTPGHVSGWLGDGRAEEICKDMDFPDTIRSDAAKGIRLMGVPAGDMGIDGWQHGIMSVMRGVEGGFSIVRAAHDGLVFASDAQGRLVALKKDAPAGVTMIVADLPLGSGPTLYTRIGNAFPWLCGIFALALGAGLAAWRRRSAARRFGN
ncbi:nitrilase-related carbon-nitrogen hydrolase [Rhodanobacter ginsengisoli]|uniref:Nitrilase-related carbon-nitrogen hydrolase n=1 Tax=Rhodanobacter ginsengisoli TaxID=418646 RepID=A0ABW0QRY9_9GAMM